MVKSIFELERRFDFDKELNRLLNLLDQKIYDCEYSYHSVDNFWAVVDRYFMRWEYRLTAINVDQYFYDLEINLKSLGSSDDTQKLYILQFIDSYICYLIDTHKITNEYSINLKDEIYVPYLAIIENIGIILKNLNFKRQFNEEDTCITYIKRDADVDSTLLFLEKEKDVRLALLEYNDFRIEKDDHRKCELIIQLLKYMEKNENKYKHHSLYNTLTRYANKFDVRHGDKKQIETNSDEDRIYILDTCFKLILHIIRQQDLKIRIELINNDYFQQPQ